MGEETSDDGSWLCGCGVKLLVIVCGFLILRKIWPDLRRRYFAAFMAILPRILGVDLKMEEMKKDIFATLGSVTSQDPKLRKENSIKLLEIGVGTGTNFQYYPNGTHLIVIDPNPHFKKYYDENRRKFPNIHSEEIIVTTGEKMDMIPPNSVDVVVSTLVLCSVDGIDEILKQIHRVLAPGGKFYFYEHVADFDLEKHGTRRRIQEFLTTTGIWQFMFDGCELNRDLLSYIERAGFSKIDGGRFYSPINSFMFQLVQPSIKGVAEK